MSATKTQENPLVPNQKLRQMHERMVELRILGDLFAGLRDIPSGQIIDSIRNEEACRVATAIDLAPGDLISDAQPGPAMNHLAGLPVAALLAQVSDPRRKSSPSTPHSQPTGRLMPWLPATSDRLRLALGAAVALKRAGQQKIVLAYAYPADLSKKQWSEILKITGTLELPIVFVLLPGPDPIKLHTKSQTFGVPGMPADASDAVALYRVMQESLGRARNDGGPVLIECLAFAVKGSKSIPDPVIHLENLLASRKLATPRRLASTGTALRNRISRVRTAATPSKTLRSK